MLLGSKGQAGIYIIIGLVMIALAFVLFSLLSPILKETIDTGRAAADAHNDTPTKFFITAIPIFIIILFVIRIAWVASGGGT